MVKKPRNVLSLSKGMEAFRLLGPRLFYQSVGCQLYSAKPYLVLVHELDGLQLSDGKASLERASSEDVARFFDLMIKESGRLSRRELLVRREFYDKGFHDCYISRTLDSHEMCSITWFVTSRDIHETGYDDYYPKLKENEVFGENLYVLEKFRGKGLAVSEGLLLRAIAKSQGYSRMLSYVREDNIPSLANSKKMGALIFQRIVRHKLLFRVSTRIINQFDPPIPISLSEKRIIVR